MKCLHCRILELLEAESHCVWSAVQTLCQVIETLAIEAPDIARRDQVIDLAHRDLDEISRRMKAGQAEPDAATSTAPSTTH